MKKSLLVPVALLGMLFVTCCKDKPTTKDEDTLQTDSIVSLPDSTLWGHLGEGTAMSVVEFITDKGDTLYLAKNSEQTQLAGEILGTIRNFTDRFAITTRGAQVDEGNSIQTCINVSELMGTWTSGQTKISLYADGTADNASANYNAWQIMNGRLILSVKVSTEYGETSRTDTMRIISLDEDSLRLLTPQHEEIAFGR